MAAIAHPLAGPLANNPHWNQAPGPGQGNPAQPLSRNRLDPDFNLVERCLSGDEAAWEALVRTHTRRVYGFCYRFTGKDSEAQDLTQEGFLSVFRSLKSYRSDEGAFATWLARLSRNLLIDHYRRSRQDRSTDSIEEQLPMIEERVATSARPEGLLAGREASEILQGALQRLSAGRHGALGRDRGLRSWLTKALAPVLQPRLVMGMALTILSFSMMARWAGISPRQLSASDMDPKKIWASLDDRAMRAWARSVKFYEDIKIVYEIQSRLRDWTEQQEEEDRNAAARRPVEDRRGHGANPSPPTAAGDRSGRT